MNRAVLMKFPAGTLQHTALKRTQLITIGVDIKKFSTQFNELTSKYIPNTPVRCCIYYKKREFEVEILGPVSSSFLIRAAGLSRGAKKSGHERFGEITPVQLYEIAKFKKREPYLRYVDIQTMVRCLAGQCRSVGIKIVPHKFAPFNQAKKKKIEEKVENKKKIPCWVIR